MSARIRILHIEAEGDGIGAALDQLAAFLGQSEPVAALPAATVRALPAERPTKVRKAPVPSAGLESDAAILGALKFRPMRVSELADALHTDKRHVAKATIRLYSKLTRLVRDGQVKRVGKTYAVK